MTEALLEAYQRLHRTGPEFGGDEEGNHGLTNHGPMAAEVMVRRGLDVRLDVWLDRYIGRLAELPSAGDRITAATWRDALGDYRRIADWTAFFRTEVRARPWQETLATWWPRLLPGVLAGSTHGVIRTGHAVRTLLVCDGEHALDELAHGLAFWAARSRAVPGDLRPSGTLDPAAALDALPRLPERSGFIAHRIARLGTLPGWTSAASALGVPEDPADVPAALAGLVDAALARYLRVGRDAPVLLVHTATAPNAILHCLPVLPRSLWAASLAGAWSAVAAITATYAGPPAPAIGTTDATVSGTLDLAASHGDEHVIKFADTAVDSYERFGNPDALAAVRLAALLIEAP